MDSYDVVVIGAGLAGLQCTRLLAGHGLAVALVDRKESLEQAVHTTGIFVRRSLDDFALPPSCFGPAIRHVTLYSPARRTIELESPHDEFRVARMAPLYTRLLKDCQAAGRAMAARGRVPRREDSPAGSIVHLKRFGQNHSIAARYVIAADGAQSRVARDLELDANRQWIVGVEDVFEGVPLNGPPRLHCFLDRRIAPGYIAWIAEDGTSTHVGVGGYAARFQPLAALDRFRASLGAILNLRASTLVERRGGRIPVGGVLKKLANPRGLAIGDAAGAVSPLTAGGLDPCLRLSELAATVTWRFLTTGNAAGLAAYNGSEFRRKFRRPDHAHWSGLGRIQPRVGSRLRAAAVETRAAVRRARILPPRLISRRARIGGRRYNRQAPETASCRDALAPRIAGALDLDRRARQDQSDG